MRNKRAVGLKDYIEECAAKGRIPPAKEIIAKTGCSLESLPKAIRGLKDRYDLIQEHDWAGPVWEYGGGYISTPKLHAAEHPSRSNGNMQTWMEQSELIVHENQPANSDCAIAEYWLALIEELRKLNETLSNGVILR